MPFSAAAWRCSETLVGLHSGKRRSVLVLKCSTRDSDIFVPARIHNRFGNSIFGESLRVGLGFVRQFCSDRSARHLASPGVIGFRVYRKKACEKKSSTQTDICLQYPLGKMTVSYNGF